MVKTTININTKVKVKDIEIEEYEKIMNVWRACMLFFEREIRKLHDRTELTTETLQKVAKNIDFTELLRTNFLSIPDQERMRLVKLKEVAEAIQKVQQLSEHEIQEIQTNQPYQYPVSDSYQTEFQGDNYQATPPEPSEPVINPISSILKQENQLGDQNRPEINVKDHLKVLQRNTASSVIELRKMMYQNIQKIRQTLFDEST